jgi:hypothetical protein
LEEHILEKTQIVFGVVDPRTRLIKQVATVKATPNQLDHYWTQFFPNTQYENRKGPFNEWVRELQTAGLEPQFVILEMDADEAAKTRWIARLLASGNTLLNQRDLPGANEFDIPAMIEAGGKARPDLCHNR